MGEILNKFLGSLANVFHRKKKHSHYKEIFSTAENLRNTQNTNPLLLDDDFSKTQNGDYAQNSKKWIRNYKDRRAKILQQELFEMYPEYNGPLYAHAVKDALKKEIKALNKQALWICAIFTISVCLDFSVKIIPNFLDFPLLSVASLQLIVSTFLLVLSFILGYKTIKKALAHLSKVIFTLETSVIFPAIASTINCLALLFLSFFNSSFRQNTFVSLFLLHFLLVILTNLLSKKRILSNLRFVASSKQKFNVDVLPISKVTQANKSKRKIFMTHQHKTDFLSNFIQNSHEEDFAEKLVSNLVPFSVIFSLVCGILNFSFTQNAESSLVALNISALLSLPVALPFVSSLILSLLSKFALKNRAMVVGESGLKKLARAKSVVLNDSDLYPPNNVILRGIKTFSGQRVDEAIILAATLVCRLGAPISHVFDKIILGKKAVLSKASNVKYVDGRGAIGWVNGQRVLVGNRELLKEYKIAPPSHDYEEKYKMPNCELTYFAVGGELVAMFILEYLPSKALSGILHSCIKNNIKIFIKTVDCNVTVQKVANDFGLREKHIIMLDNKEKQVADQLDKKIADKTSTFAATLGESSSLLKLMCGAASTNAKLLFTSFAQGLQILINFFIVLYLILEGSAAELHNTEWMLYLFFWLAFSLALPNVKRFY